MVEKILILHQKVFSSTKFFFLSILNLNCIVPHLHTKPQKSASYPTLARLCYPILCCSLLVCSVYTSLGCLLCFLVFLQVQLYLPSLNTTPATFSIIPFYPTVRFVTLLPHYLCSRTRLGVCFDSLLPHLFIAATVLESSFEIFSPLCSTRNSSSPPASLHRRDYLEIFSRAPFTPPLDPELPFS